MANLAHPEALFQETLEVARNELRDLNGQIERLRSQLSQLERQKKAVENICEAIHCWLEATVPTKQKAPPFPTVAHEDQMVSVALTEEEVAILTAPPQLSDEV